MYVCVRSYIPASGKDYLTMMGTNGRVKDRTRLERFSSPYHIQVK